MTDTEETSTGSRPPDVDFQGRFFCKLFDDMIVKDLCLLRRSELKGRDSFSCGGCSKDIIMTGRTVFFMSDGS